ncbi:MAG: HAMP domain-containing sensor histidine kinase [Oceanipulchritudo sp.]
MSSSPRNPRFRKVFLLLGAAVVGIFALAVLLGIYVFRTEVREKVLQRDRQLMTRVAQHLHENLDPLGIPEWDLTELALDSSRIEGIVAVRVFDADGQWVEMVPISLFPVRLPGDTLRVLADGRSRIEFYPDLRLDTLFSDAALFEEANRAPLVEILVPLTDDSGRVTASIQYWLDGTTIRNEFAAIDRHLLLMGSLFILGGMAIFTVVFMAARRRLLSMAEVIETRNRALEEANRELALAARTSAIGSVASHLFHGLKSPLAGLKTYLKVVTRDKEALAITDRMQSLIEESLSVFREEDTGPDSELSLHEFRDLARNRLAPGNTGETGRLVLEVSGEARIPARKAQLLLLMLRNLVDNALEASPPGTPVTVTFEGRPEILSARVVDRGQGLPETVRHNLFDPVTSTKPEGSGIGLAISSVIARHIPARLDLLESGPEGTSFRIEMPL